MTNTSIPTSPATAPTVTSRVAANFIWSLVGEGIGKGAMFAVHIYLARKLGAAGYGLFALTQSVVLYVWVAVDLGTAMYGIREVAKIRDHPGDLISDLSSLRITASLVVLAFFALSAALLGGKYTLLYIGTGLYLVFYALSTDWVLKGLEQFKYLAFGIGATAVSFLVLCLLFVKGAQDVVLVGFAWSLSYLVGSASLLLVLAGKLKIKLRYRLRLATWKAHLRESIYFSLSGALMLLYQMLPIFLVGYLFSPAQVGIFSAPYKMMFAATTVAFYLAMAFYPVLSERAANEPSSVSGIHRLLKVSLLAVGIPAALAGYEFAGSIIWVLFGPAYAASTPILRVLVWLIPLYMARYSYGVSLNALGGQRLHVIASTACVTAMIAVAVPSAVHYGLVGCAVSLLIAECVFVLAMRIMYKRALRRFYRGATGSLASVNIEVI